MSEASKYLQSYAGHYWQYEDGGKVIAVPGGHTLGYSEHLIEEVISYLAPYGLPRFGTLILALAATNSQGVSTLGDILLIIEARAERNQEIEEGYWFAKLLTQLPARYKQGNLRIQLLRTIFADGHNKLSRKRSSRINAELKGKPSVSDYPDAWRQEELSDYEFGRLAYEDFKALALVQRKLGSVEAIVAALSGLPPVQQELLELAPEKEYGNEAEGIVEQLTKDDTTFHVGSLVARLISGLHLSFHTNQPSDQALGGVADITNKGSFDRLLMSEFAYDDDVLMTRLANNQSLYHHREAPPADNDFSRIILIDTTLQNWGTIRTVSFAAMLAIAHHPKNRNPCRVFLIGESYRQISFATAADVVDGMAFPDPSLNPGPGLEQLFTQEETKVSEIFYLGAEAVLATPEMQRFSATFGKHIDHWIHPNQEGEIKVYKNPKRGKRFVQALKLPLEKLWTQPRQRQEDKSTFSNLDFPILFPEGRMKTKWKDGRFVYALSKKKGLFRTYDGLTTNTAGWELVTENVERSDLLKAVMTHEDLSVTALVANQRDEYALVGQAHEERITLPNYRHLKGNRPFYVQDGCFKTSTGIRDKTILIHRDGTVTEEAYSAHEQDTPTFRNRAANIYQNLHRVYLTVYNQLRFGKQDLFVKNGDLLLSHQEHRAATRLEAEQRTPGTFTFADGSHIVHNPNGMLTLVSANKDITKIHFPCVIDAALGVATQHEFAGNTYYQKRYKIEIAITRGRARSPELTRIISETLPQISLQKAKAMALNNLIVLEEEQVSAIRLALTGAKFRYLVQRRGTKQNTIPVTEFYDQYIQEFINHIIDHGAQAD